MHIWSGIAPIWDDSTGGRNFSPPRAYPGPSLIIAYSHCIAHGITMKLGPSQQKLAVDSGAWFLYRYNPLLKLEGKNTLSLDSREPKADIEEYLYNENRFRALKQKDPEKAEKYLVKARTDARKKFDYFKFLAGNA